MAVSMVVLVAIVALSLVPRLRRALFPIYLQEPGHELTGHRYLYDAQLGWRNIPGWQSTTMGKPLSINSHGLRDREYKWDKPPGVKRILVLGDSFAWGYGVADSEIFTEVLERELAGGKQSWQVLNSGVSGWGTDQEYLFLNSEGFRYSPDIVILAFFCVNDPTNNGHWEQYGLRKPVFRSTNLDLANVPVPQPGTSSVLILTADAPIDVTVAIVRSMADQCESRGVPLVVLKFGQFLLPGDAELQYVSERLADLGKSHAGVTYLDWDEWFNTQPTSTFDILRGNNDGHWNALGHELTGKMLAEILRDRQIVE
jgi:lysophospholipase L1-like esterase